MNDYFYDDFSIEELKSFLIKEEQMALEVLNEAFVANKIQATDIVCNKTRATEIN